MKRFRWNLTLASAIIVAAAPFARASVEPELNISVRRIGDRVLILNVPSAQSTNVVALKSNQGIVVVDTEVSPVLAEAIRHRIESEFDDSRIAVVINTHGHGDHTYGNQVFSDALIVGHEAVRPAMEAAEDRRRTMAARLGLLVENLSTRLDGLPPDEEAAIALKRKVSYYESVRRGLGDGFQLTFPTITFSEGVWMDLGDLTLELTWFGVSHSDSDILVYCPEEGLLLTGDLFAPGVDLYVDSERIEQFPRWIANLEEIVEKSDSLAAVIPGHGEPFSADALQSTLTFVRDQDRKFAGKTSGFAAAREAFENESIDAGLQHLRRAHVDPQHFYLIHSEVDSFGFQMMMEDRVDDALKIFALLAELFPANDVAFDSLGEAHLRRGEDDLAATDFRRALELNPDNRNAAARLAELTK